MTTAMMVPSHSIPAPMSSSSDSSEVAEIASASRAGVGAPARPMRVRARPVVVAQMTSVMLVPIAAEPIASG